MVHLIVWKINSSHAILWYLILYITNYLCGNISTFNIIFPYLVMCVLYFLYFKSSCVHTGEYVERQFCRDAILPMPSICEVPCPKDCALSPWTPWSLCSHTCSGKNTEGKQTRARSILAYNAGEGRNTCILNNDPGISIFDSINHIDLGRFVRSFIKSIIT